jgi:hypothetical protein
VSVFMNSAHVALLVAMTGMATICGFVLTERIRDDDANAAWVWLGLFMATSFGAAWAFWRLV